MKILTILGARPQFIKAATVSRVIAGNKEIKELILHTGQHFDANMSDVFFEQLNIPQPSYHLGISNASHGAMTGRMLEAIETVLNTEQPDWVLVYGDTNSTLAGALAAVKLHIPVAHVEAGLRSNNPAMPEEINRIITDRVSSMLFCPTETAVKNLQAEGFPFSDIRKQNQQIHNTGDVMYDATLYYKEKSRAMVSLKKWDLTENGYALCTLHRAENTNDPLRLQNIFEALQIINKKIPVVLPLHPRTRNLLQKMDKLQWLDGLYLLDPLPYLEIQRLQMSAKVILTDSGGMQKEAYFHQVPCITLRDETEWPETLIGGWNQLSKAESEVIISTFHKLNNLGGQTAQLYGSGNAAEEIVEKLWSNR